MIPFLTALLAFPCVAEAGAVAPEVVAEPAVAHDAPGFDLSGNPFAKVVAEDPKPEEFGKWHGNISFGASISDGNTDRKTFSASGKAINRREKDRITFELLWNYAEESDFVTQRRTYGSGKYDYFVSKKLYYLGQVSGENDKNSGLDLRMIYTAGAGYQFREDEVWKIAGEAGLAYVDESYQDSMDDADYLAARLAYNADWKPNEQWTAGQSAQIYPSLEESDDVNAVVDTHTKVTLTANMFAQLQWIFTWDNTPSTGADRVDNLYLLTVGWSF
jgi:putative salt-induced outer membrane protein YdiY